jgi:putative addiction module CopG family antidote
VATSADLGKTLEKFVTKLVATGRYHSKSEVLREGVRLIQERETRLAAMPQLHGVWPTPIRDASNQLPKCLTVWKRSSRQRQIDGDRFG